MYQKKKTIVEQEIDKRFFHLHIYKVVRYLFKNYTFSIKLIWFVFIALALMGKI